MERTAGGDETKKGGAEEEMAGKTTEGLPVESSPYTQYKDIEDYKRKGYGTEGHQQPVEGRGAGATDAPTPSGAAPVTSKREQTAVDISPTDTINRQGVP